MGHGGSRLALVFRSRSQLERAALSARAGIDLPIGPRLAISPYAGFLTMLGRGGPRVLTGPISDINDPGARTRLMSFQLGAAITFAP
jgi:hypothetical protein